VGQASKVLFRSAVLRKRSPVPEPGVRWGKRGKTMRSIVRLGVLALVLASLIVQGQEKTGAPIDQYVGCYTLTCGPWVSSNPREKPSASLVPPSCLRLAAEHGPGGPGRTCNNPNGGTVYPANRAALSDPRFEIGCWFINTDGALAIVWTNMMEYVEVVVKKEGDAWHGKGKTGGDAGPGAFSCQATLNRAPCGKEQQ